MQAESVNRSGLTRLANAITWFSQRYWNLVLFAMLGLLHVATLRGVTDDWARALLLAHLGLLLLWQPFLRGQHRVSVPQAAFILAAVVAVTLWLDWWLLAFWVVLLTGLIGGKVYQQQAKWQRRSYLVVLVYLLALLTVVILPQIAPSKEITPEVRGFAEYGLPVWLALVALFPVESESPDVPQVIDFFYSVFVMLVLGVLILGSFAFMTIGRTAYLPALTYTVFSIAGTVLLVGLAWNPRTGYAGLNVFFSRYLFSVGLPVERWLHFLAELSQMEAHSEKFLAEGIQGLARLPWVSGVTWRAAHDQGEAGEKTPHAVEYANSELAFTIYSRYRTSPTLHWHLYLLGQLLGEYYLAKLREEKLRQQSYLQAVHETGARVTHDVKNLLQSLNVLCSIAGRGDAPEPQALIRRQLPVIAQRLSATLEKLQQPQPEAENLVAARAWWEGLTRQYRDQDIDFDAEAVSPRARVPRSLFDSVTDNLLQNAIAKRGANAPVRIRVSLRCDEVTALRVCDSGAAVPDPIARQLLRAPVHSNRGLGIGLYQAARQAESAGYVLALESNRDGEVCFSLSSRPEPVASAAAA